MRALNISTVKKGTRILMRVDCNVPLVHRAVDSRSAWRLEQTLSDIRTLQKRGAIVLLLGHLGDPKGEVRLSLSLRPIARWYEKHLKTPVRFLKDPTDRAAVEWVRAQTPGSIIMVENLRFWKGEEGDSARFAKQIAHLGNVYVNNAFGVCHRKHASVHAIRKYLPSYAGSLLVAEVLALKRRRPHPLVLVLGGVKLQTKMPLLMKLGREASTILLGGGIAIALASLENKRPLSIAGTPISRADRTIARQVLRMFKKKIILPKDYVCRRAHKNFVVAANDLHTTDVILDIGPMTIKHFRASIHGARTLIVNGTMGNVESRAGEGTLSIARAIRKDQYSIVGGGDTVGFLQKNKALARFSFVSTGGGAMLAFLSGERLPGIRALT